MCVIAYKAKDVRFPSDSNIEAMWKHNPDGAGIMWRRNAGEAVKFAKGFMKLKDFRKFIGDNRTELVNSEVVLHFRITTHGGTCPKNCHPFVIGDNPHIMSGEAKRILMHNGILPLVPRRKDISDTGELAIRLGECESPSKSLASLDECLYGNRIILMDENGTHFFGDKFKTSAEKENKGLLYSNLNHEPRSNFGSFGFSGSNGGYFVRNCEGFYYDGKNNVFRMKSNNTEVPLEDVDPDFLSDEDYEVYESKWNEDYQISEIARSYGFTPAEYRDIEIEAQSYGMSVDDYIRDVIGEEDWCWGCNDEELEEERSAS